MPITRETMLKIAGVDLEKFRSRQRREQVPFDSDRENEDLARKIFGYELKHALALALSDALTNAAVNPSRAKELVEGFEAGMFLPSVPAQIYQQSGEVWVLLTQHSQGANIRFAGSYNDASALGSDQLESKQNPAIHSFTIISFTEQMKRAEAVLREIGRAEEDLWRNQDRILRVGRN